MENKVMASVSRSIRAGIGVIMSHLKVEGRSRGVNWRGYLRVEVFSEGFLVCRREPRTVLNEEMGTSYKRQIVGLNEELRRTIFPQIEVKR
jgi:hypothetical protein